MNSPRALGGGVAHDCVSYCDASNQISRLQLGLRSSTPYFELLLSDGCFSVRHGYGLIICMCYLRTIEVIRGWWRTYDIGIIQKQHAHEGSNAVLSLYSPRKFLLLECPYSSDSGPGQSGKRLQLWHCHFTFCQAYGQTQRVMLENTIASRWTQIHFSHPRQLE